MKQSDLLVVLAVVVGAAAGAALGLLSGNTISWGAMGALVGLVVGCLLSVIPPTGSVPGRTSRRRR